MPEEIRSCSISKYLQAFRKKVVDIVPAVWVHGVITQIQPRGKVVYLQIAEFQEGNVNPIASLPLIAFQSDFEKITAKIKNLSKPFSLKTDLKVKMLIEADIYIPQGKFQGKVKDIDPTYTIGELALTREAILRRLRDEGLLHKNGKLPFAIIPLHIGLITGENTAAYSDFTEKLRSSGFSFHITPAFAKMQGNETEATILSALGTLRVHKNLDVICIIRGGGSKTDLNYFDSEALCRSVADYPIPILTGIGHEIDHSLLDYVAWSSCITPTDCAKFLIDRVREAWQSTNDLALSIAGRIQTKITSEKEKQRRINEKLSLMMTKIFSHEREIQNAFFKDIKRIPDRIFQEEAAKIFRYVEGLKNGSRKILDLSKSNLNFQEALLSANDPKKILQKGYTITLDASGKALKSAKELTPGMIIRTQFNDGEIHSTVR